MKELAGHLSAHFSRMLEHMWKLVFYRNIFIICLKFSGVYLSLRKYSSLEATKLKKKENFSKSVYMVFFSKRDYYNFLYFLTRKTLEEQLAFWLEDFFLVDITSKGKLCFPKQLKHRSFSKSVISLFNLNFCFIQNSDS